MIRTSGWDRRLTAEIEAARWRRWRWGFHDCATFAWRCVRAQIEAPTPWDDLLGGHDSRAAAEAAIARAGGLMAAMDRERPRVAPIRARRGDVVAVRVAEGVALGILDGCLWHAAPRGLARSPLGTAIALWPIED